MSEQNQQDEAFNNLLARHNNDAAAAARELFSQNYRLREQRRQLESQNANLLAQVPDDDSVVIPRADNEVFQALRELGELEQVREQLTAGQQAIEERNQLQRREAIRQTLPSDYHAEAVLELLPADASLARDGENIVIQQGDTRTPLEDWEKQVSEQKPYIMLRRTAAEPQTTFAKQAPKANSTANQSKLLLNHADRNFGGNKRG